MTSSEEISKKPPSNKQRYNMNASVFYPSYNSQSYLVKVSNLAFPLDKNNFIEFISSTIQEKIGSKVEISYKILKFEKEITDIMQSYAILEILSWELAMQFVDILNGYEWNNCILSAVVVSNSFDKFQNQPSSFYNPYLSNLPYFYNNMYKLPSDSLSYPAFNNSTPSYSNRRMSNKSLESRRTSRSDSNATKPVPPFLLNLVNDSKGNENVFDNTNSESENESTGSTEHSTIKNDGQSVKINPCRLFVGNIPYSSTWPALKGFLISKCEELEPNSNIEVLKVEIPMQTTHNSTLITGSKLNSYQYMPNGVKDKSTLPQNLVPTDTEIGKSRGFAIVTTGSQESSAKIIELLDNTKFEGRPLTIRYDKFPEFNNYVLQQLFPYSNSKMNNKSSVLSYLAFERNSFQQKFYYGNNSPSANYLSLPPYYSMHNPSLNLISLPQFASHYSSMPYPIAGYFPFEEFSGSQPNRYFPNYEIPRTHKSNKMETKTFDSNVGAKSAKSDQDHEDNLVDLDADDKTKSLINSFRSLELSTS